MLTPMQFQLKRNRILNIYYDIETQFIELSRIIPIDNDDQTYSPRLYNILQMSCGQVENMMRLICDKLGIDYLNPDKPNWKPNFPAYYKKINENNILSIQMIALREIDIKETTRTYHPFELVSNEHTPFWWTAYNNTKHDLPEGYRQGNLKNTLHALSAVYSIHCMAYYVQHVDTKESFLDRSHWWGDTASYTGDGELISSQFDPLPKSELFYSCTRFNAHGLPM